MLLGIKQAIKKILFVRKKVNVPLVKSVRRRRATLPISTAEPTASGHTETSANMITS